MPVKIEPAATVVLIRDRPAGLQVLLLRRNAALQFAAGMWVFPGGKVDKVEIDASATAIEAARLAAVRETREETRLDVALDALHEYARWVTPEGSPRRFSTWFFVSRCDGSSDVVVDGSEIKSHQWLIPGDALERHRDGAMHLMAPTFVTLRELSVCNSVSEVLARVKRRRAPVYEPRTVRVEDRIVSLYSEDAGYQSRDPSLPGPRHRLVRAGTGWEIHDDDFVQW